MEIDLNKTLRALVRCLPEDGEPSVEALAKMYRQTLRLRSQLLGIIYDLEAYSAPQPGRQELAEAMSRGRQEDGCVILTFEESLPSMKEYSAALEDHWKAMIHAAIQEAAAQEGLPRFDRAFVQIEVTTPRGSNNRMAAYYSEQLSQNIRRGQRASAAKAQSIGGNRPLGYRTGPDKKFMIDPETAPTVKWIYDLYAQAKTIAEIVNLLNSWGLRTLHGRPFTHNSLRTLLKNEKYIGVYTYKDEVRIEGAIPSIIDPDTFEKVQRMLKYNQKAAAHKNAKTEYLLTEKLFCGKCGAMMVGVSGTGKSGVHHHYYYCSGQRRKICDKKPVRKKWIEQLVLKRIAELLQNDEILAFIAENTYRYYVRQNTDSSYTESLRAELRDTENAMANLVRALEAGIFNDATRTRMEELDEQKRALSASLAAARLKQDLGLKVEFFYADMLYRF